MKRKVPYDKIATITYVMAAPVAAVVGLLIGFLTSESGWISGLVCGCFLGILGLASSVKELEQRMEHDSEDRRRHMDNAEFFRLVSRVAATEDQIFSRHGKEVLERARKTLQRAANGELLLDDQERLSLALELASSIQEELLATLLWAEHDPMGPARDTQLGRLYSAATRKERPVRIKRLFLIKPGDENDLRLEERVRKDIEHGRVEVRLLFQDQWLGSDDELAAPLDFGVWDRKRVWSYRPTEIGGTKARRVVLLAGEDHVSRYAKAFKANFQIGISIDHLLKMRPDTAAE